MASKSRAGGRTCGRALAYCRLRRGEPVAYFAVVSSPSSGFSFLCGILYVVIRRTRATLVHSCLCLSLIPSVDVVIAAGWLRHGSSLFIISLWSLCRQATGARLPAASGLPNGKKSANCRINEALCFSRTCCRIVRLCLYLSVVAPPFPRVSRVGKVFSSCLPEFFFFSGSSCLPVEQHALYIWGG